MILRFKVKYLLSYPLLKLKSSFTAVPKEHTTQYYYWCSCLRNRNILGNLRLVHNLYKTAKLLDVFVETNEISLRYSVVLNYSKAMFYFTEAVAVLYEDVLGVVDFHPSSDTAVLYISEADLAVSSAYRRRAVRLRKVTF